MADIELVIKMPEDTYRDIKEHGLCGYCSDREIVSEAVANGTLLPKGHDIIDGTELNKYLDDLIYAEQKIRLDGYETRTDIVERIKIKSDTLTIIKADEESRGRER